MHAFQLMKGGKMNFGRGMRSMLGKWYSDKSSDQLFDFLYSTRKYERISHKNIIYKLHLKIDDKEKNKVCSLIALKFDDLIFNGFLKFKKFKYLKYVIIIIQN